MNSKNILVSLVGIILIVFIAWGSVTLSKKGSNTIADTASSTPIENPVSAEQGSSTPVDVPPSPSTKSKYKDGVYTAEGVYVSPGGGQKVKVTLTLNNDVVTALTVTPEPSDPESEQYQGRFTRGVTQYVVGKNIDEVNVSRVSGSSLTSRGFNDALDTIKSEALA